jgi:hypothetical protein
LLRRHTIAKKPKACLRLSDLRGRSEAILRGAPTPAEIEVTR